MSLFFPLPVRSAPTLSAVFRLAARSSLPTSSTATRCPSCLRSLPRHGALRPSATRSMQTATAYRPSTLTPSHEPPPAQNRGTPGAEMTAGELGEAARRAETSLPQQEQGQPRPPPPTHSGQKQQASTQTATSSSSSPSPSSPASTSTTTSTRPRPKLRARKAAMKLTPAAVSQLRELLAQPEPKLIRVGVKNRGCSGLSYNLEYVDQAGRFDEAVEQDGVKVLVDNKALFSIIGSEMDWIEDKLSRKFVFRNPNITESCGCGESFSVS